MSGKKYRDFVWMLSTLPLLVTLLTSQYGINVTCTSVSCIMIPITKYDGFYKDSEIWLQYPFIQYGKDMCAFNFECPNECKCTLTGRNMIQICPSGLSLFPVEYRNYLSLENDTFSPSYHTYAYGSRYGYFTVVESSINDIFGYDFLNENASSEAWSMSEASIFSWDGAGISVVQYGAFEQIKHLENLHLVLTHNSLSVIEDGIFEGITNLNGLYLSVNDIMWIHPRAFDDLSNLQYLFLIQNNITELHSQQFQRLTSLNILSLSKNQITRVDQSLFLELVNLKKLDVSYNNITDIHPPQFQECTNLISLLIDHNNINIIQPQQFLGLTNLEILILYDNNISDNPSIAIPWSRQPEYITY